MRPSAARSGLAIDRAAPLRVIRIRNLTTSLRFPHPRLRRRWKIGFCLVLFSFLAASACHAQNRDVLCREGVGEFNADFFTGVKVHVGAGRNKELAARVCDASLAWADQTLALTSSVAELDTSGTA